MPATGTIKNAIIPRATAIFMALPLALVPYPDYLAGAEATVNLPGVTNDSLVRLSVTLICISY